MDILIRGINVRCDARGLYSLNDFHKADGNNLNKTPTDFIRSFIVSDFIDYSDIKLNSKYSMDYTNNNNNVFVCKILLSYYALWLNPELGIELFELFENQKYQECVKGYSSSTFGSFNREPKQVCTYYGLNEKYDVNNNIELENKVNVMPVKKIKPKTAPKKTELKNILKSMKKIIDKTKPKPKHMEMSVHSPILTVTDISKELGISTKKVNDLLVECNFQKKIQNGNNSKWKALTAGKPYCHYADTGRKHANHAPVKKLVWDSKVIKIISAKKETLDFLKINGIK